MIRLNSPSKKTPARSSLRWTWEDFWAIKRNQFCIFQRSLFSFGFKVRNLAKAAKIKNRRFSLWKLIYTKRFAYEEKTKNENFNKFSFEFDWNFHLKNGKLQQNFMKLKTIEIIFWVKLFKENREVYKSIAFQGFLRSVVFMKSKQLIIKKIWWEIWSSWFQSSKIIRKVEN